MNYKERHSHYFRKINATTLPEELLHKEAPGMLSRFDRQAYYYAAKEMYTFDGLLVDAGALLGATAKCFARGLCDNVLFPGTPQEPLIYSYDHFKFVPYVRQFFETNNIPIPESDSFKTTYLQYINKYKEFIFVEDGDLLKKKWEHDKYIEVLGVDAAKEATLVKYFLYEFFTQLKAGKSTILFQDYIFYRHPSLLIATGMLSRHLRKLCEGVFTAVFDVTQDITREDIDSLLHNHAHKDSQISILENIITESISSKYAAIMSLALCVFIKQVESSDIAKKKFQEVKKKFRAELESADYFASQLQGTENIINREQFVLNEFLQPD